MILGAVPALLPDTPERAPSHQPDITRLCRGLDVRGWRAGTPAASPWWPGRRRSRSRSAPCSWRSAGPCPGLRRPSRLPLLQALGAVQRLAPAKGLPTLPEYSRAADAGIRGVEAVHVTGGNGAFALNLQAGGMVLFGRAAARVKSRKSGSLDRPSASATLLIILHGTFIFRWLSPGRRLAPAPATP